MAEYYMYLIEVLYNKLLIITTMLPCCVLCGPALVTGDISHNRNHNHCWQLQVLLLFLLFCMAAHSTANLLVDIHSVDTALSR